MVSTRLARASVVLALLVGCRSTPPTPSPSPETQTAAERPRPSARPNDATPSIPLNGGELATADSAHPRGGSDVTPVYTPDEEHARFTTAAGYRLELVAAEPLVQDPVAIDFDADGRMYVVEMRAYMPNLEGTGEDRPVGRIVVLEDTNDDGRMDRRTIFLDSLVLPRAVKVLAHGVLVAETPHLWFARDTTGDLRADTKVLVRDDYGTKSSNPEHNANGLFWGLDNWIHNANYGGEFRLRADGTFDFRRAEDEGQWGVSSDAHGRLYRNSNEDPLRADLVPSRYAARNPLLPAPRGIYEQLTQNVPVWPGHKTPAVNRGYRAETLRPGDSTLAHYTSAGSPTAYVGDRLPAELHRSVFVTESAGNMVGRFVVDEDTTGFPTARSAYDHAEFITNSDQRFRPVNLANAPDGTLYVVDMYRGIIQHRVFITDYLAKQIRDRGMEQPIGLGRIWRVVHTTTQRGERPRLSGKTPAELVPLLAHPNGWWRFEAQQLLVERGDRSVAPAVRELLRASADDRARLHALWTLDGLGAVDEATVRAALADSSAPVRAAALRIAEPWLARGDVSMRDRVMALAADRAPLVRRQLAASLGELPVGERDDALLRVIAASGDDPVVADMVVTGLAGRELAFLERMLDARGASEAHDAPVVRSLSAALLASRDSVRVGRLLALLGPARARWQRLALLGYTGEPRADGGDGGFAAPEGGGFRRRRTAPIALGAVPRGLVALLASRDSVVRGQAERVAARLTWPGLARRAPAVAPLTPEERARYAAGQKQYLATCSGCHQARGTGLPGAAKPLVGSQWVLGSPARLIRIVLQGKEGAMLMPPIGSSLTDDQLASVLTYIRRSWGNTASAIPPMLVHDIRAETQGRTKPWTEEELQAVRGR
jgi:mono/diheme cytochrome c family protein/glucose/arabinose dehydrogenase